MNTKRDKALATIRVVVWIFMIGAAAISFSHIVQVSTMLGLGWEAWTVPFFVDGIAIVGKVSMLPRFSRGFRRSGFRLLMLGGTLSLAANVAAGSNWGERAFGVLVVAGFMLLESHATKADRTAIAEVAPESRRLDPETAAQRAAKAAITREWNKYQAMSPGARKKYREEHGGPPARPAHLASSVAPTSPGRGPVKAPSAAQVAEVVG